MLKKIVHSLMALTMAGGLVTAPVHQAEARDGAGVAAGVAAGIIGLGIIGAAASRPRGYYYGGYGPECYRGPRRCHWINRHCFEDRYGDLTCRGGDYICDRPMICD